MSAPPPSVLIEDERAPLSVPADESPGPSPIVFASPRGQLAGFHHVARPPFARATTVVLCPPVGYDAMLVHRTYRHLAERLSALGFHVLRFDYHGTGDSSGRQEDSGRVAAWMASIDAAIDYLGARTGIRRTCLFGVRTGALLAAAVADRRDDVSTLVLWAPGQSGRSYVREFRAFTAVKETPSPSNGAPAQKDEVVAGYLFSAETLDALSHINLLSAEFAGVKRALVLARDDLPGAEPRLVAHLTAKGVQAEHPSVAGYAGMMRDAEFSTLPDAALGYMVDWLAAAHEPAPKPSGPVPRSSRSAALVVASRAGQPVQERALAYDDEERLFGILTQRVEPIGRRARTALLFLNVGSNHHVGPHRMYVGLGRELAALGFSAFRFDVAGLGDSRAHPGTKENLLYARRSIGDVQQAMTYLARTIEADRFILFGICSGAYLAFHTTVADARVSGQILVNPQTFAWREGDSLEIKIKKESYKATRFYRQAILKKDTWQRLYRREINLLGIADELYGRSRQQLAARVSRALSMSPDEAGHVARSFVDISERGSHSLLVYSGNDGGIDVIESHLGAGCRRMRRRKNFRFEIIDGADHTITPLQSQEQLERILIGYMCSVFT
ncbi:MAG TPA: alpha/beta fold hydrolase [Polyangiaceae bacterium]|nr:alpha/beta fold hydrolase [Polyangiaceae bacterium]